MASGKATPKPIPALASAPTTLQPASIQVQTHTGQPFAAQNSYRVIRADGSDSGLAITPYLDQNEGQGTVTVKDNAWSITHTGLMLQL